MVRSTGIAGLTLGGGFGWLKPKHGLALDNLRAADLVLADGRVVRASADENQDLIDPAIKTKYDPGNFFKHNVNIPLN